MDRRQIIKLSLVLASYGLTAAFRDAVAAGTTKLLLVHGRAQQGRNANEIRAEWMAALSKGIGHPLSSSIEVSLPFYGDVLDNFTRQAEIPLVSDMRARGNDNQQEFLAFQAQVADKIRTAAGVTDDQVAAEYGNDPRPRGPLNWAWVQAILRAIDKNSPGMNQKTIETFTRDVFLYSTRAGVRDAIDQIVTAKLTEQPTVVVGHSLGSVVSYSVLTRETRAINIPLYVTVGSPLGIRAIRDQFIPLRRPTAVLNWYNAFDTRDVVALYPLDDSNFPVQPPIENNPNVKNGTDNRHGISGYLSDSNVAKRISTALA